MEYDLIEKYEAKKYIYGLTGSDPEIISKVISEYIGETGRSEFRLEDITAIMKIIELRAIEETPVEIQEEIKDSSDQTKKIEKAYSNIVFIPVVTTLVLLFPMIILGRAMKIDLKFLGLLLILLNVVYITVKFLNIRKLESNK